MPAPVDPPSLSGPFSDPPGRSCFPDRSDASNLDSGTTDGNGARDVFFADRAAGTTVLVSKQNAGLPSLSAAGDSTTGGYPEPAMSPDGRWIAFTSAAVNLVPGAVDGNGETDVFLHDRASHTTILVSRSMASPTTTGNGASGQPAVSDDGRWVVFSSSATDLVPGQVQGAGTSNVFLFDRLNGTTTLVSHASASSSTGGNGDSSFALLSSDGARIAYAAGQVLANNGVQSLAVATGTLAITPSVAGNGSVHVVIDVMGYFE